MTINRIGAIPIACIAVLALGFVVAALHFASIQDVWIDETTQLAGAALPLSRLFVWLATGQGLSIAVPPDRAPPISYLVDLACDRTLCAAPLQFRWLHLAILTAGTLLLIAALARRCGGFAAIVGAAILFLSPKLIEYAVEIRPYPLFIALTCAQIALLVDLVEAPRLKTGRLLLFAGVGVVSIYTHFFGLVSTMALFGGLFAARARDRYGIVAIGGIGAGVLLLAAGLKPFVAGANAASQTSTTVVDAGSILQFVLKLIGQSATLLSTPLAILFFASFAVMVAMALIRTIGAARRAGWRAPWSVTAALFVALALGLAVPLAVAMMPHGFDPLKPTYSLWAFPVLAWLAAASCAPAGPGDVSRTGRLAVPLARGAAAVFAIAAAAIEVAFLSHAPWFIHGPGSAIAAATGPAPDGVAIVYRGDWATGYFPTLWRYRDRVPQWTVTPDGTLHRLVHATIDPRAATGDPFAGARRVLVVDITASRYSDLRPLLHGAQPQLLYPSPAPPAGFTQTAQSLLPGLYWSTVTVFSRAK